MKENVFYKYPKEITKHAQGEQCNTQEKTQGELFDLVCWVALLGLWIVCAHIH